jgi:hypothetical protein
LQDNLAATELQLTSEEMVTLDKVSALPPEYPAWMVDRLAADRLGLLNPSRS